jgi:hypothetical protein
MSETNRGGSAGVDFGKVRMFGIKVPHDLGRNTKESS